MLTTFIKAAIISIAIISQASAERISVSRRTFPSTVVHIPEIGIETSKDVGESMISVLLTSIQPAAKLISPIENFRVSLMFGSATMDIPAHTLTYMGENSNGIMFLALQGGGGGGKGAIFWPKESNQSFKICYFANVTGASIICDDAPQIKPAIDIERAESRVFPNIGFKRELIYLGGSKNAINIQYREFIDNYARPAFSQEIKYDISEDRVIGYKGARFEVIRADNSGITFRMLKPLAQE